MMFLGNKIKNIINFEILPPKGILKQATGKFPRYNMHKFKEKEIILPFL